MLDREIRQALIAFLLAGGQETRIYQEKSIGSSVCDVMAVTGELTGYEIKSDGDNYAQLPAQVQAYDRFFDRNYIVVGARHEGSAAGRVPGYWGIIAVREDDVSVRRPADMVQREGRLLRRGNTNRTVRIFRYITEGSFDAYSWQVLETKQRFISQFLSGSAYQRTASDLEENVLTYAQVKALAISDLRMKELAERQNEANRLHMLSTAFGEEREELLRTAEECRRMLETQDPYAPALRQIRGEIAQMREEIAGIRAVSDTK